MELNLLKKAESQRQMRKFDDILKHTNGKQAEHPFKVPQGYFETFEDRLEAQLQAAEEQKSPRQTIVRILKPVLGLAASFVLIMLLIKYPLQEITPMIGSEELSAQNDSGWFEDVLISSTTFMDDNSLLLNIDQNEDQTPAESEELINYLSTELNDYEIFAELNN